MDKKLLSIVCHSILVDTGDLGRSELLEIDSYPSSCPATLPRTDVLSFLTFFGCVSARTELELEPREPSVRSRSSKDPSAKSAAAG